MGPNSICAIKSGVDNQMIKLDFLFNLQSLSRAFLRMKTERNKKILFGAIAVEVQNKMKSPTRQSDW